MAQYVDRSFAKMVAYKRIVTGTLGLVGGVVLSVVAFMEGRSLSPLFVLGILVFMGGGGWALRDGLRLRRQLAS
ncbi:hypothetical protein [Pendulispora albinea]|uniref:Transmembrane protein n=1 Tax=Pendulispora albinea TaxID=2741071 RepID=A0ABZ2M6C3_9BACT